MTTTRLIIACSILQLEVVIAYLSMKNNSKYNNVLILGDYDHAPKSFLTMMYSIATSSNMFQIIIWSTELFCSHKVSLNKSALSIFYKQMNSILTKDIRSNIKEIYTWSLFNRAEQVILDYFPSIQITLYEDGFNLYKLQKVSKRKIKQGEDAYNEKGIFTDHLIRTRNIIRVTPKEYARLPNYLQNKKELIIPATIYKESIRNSANKAKVLNDISLLNFNDNYKVVVVLGTRFNETVCSIEWLQEMDVYKSVITQLLNKGNRVMWKEHPRARKPFQKYLLKSFTNKVQLLSLKTEIPIEFYLSNITVDCIVSIGSSAQVILSDIFNVSSVFVSSILDDEIKKTKISIGLFNNRFKTMIV